MNIQNLLTRFAFLIIMASMLTLISGCSGKKYPDRPTIALVVKTLNNPFYNDMEDGARAAADSLKYNLVVQAAEREVDIAKQVKIVENLIQRKVDAIMLAPSGSSEVIPVILKANQANIPIINLDSKINMQLLKKDGGHIATYIGSDNEEGGRMVGKYIAKKLNGEGEVAVLEGIPGQETADARQRGFKEALSNYPKIKIVASQPANWERNMGYEVFQNILQAHNNVDAVFAANDLMALGAVGAIAQSSKDYNNIIVAGFDAYSEAVQAIKDGKMNVTIAQHPKEIGKEGIRQVNKVLNGEKVVKAIKTRIELITKEDLDKN